MRKLGTAIRKLRGQIKYYWLTGGLLTEMANLKLCNSSLHNYSQTMQGKKRKGKGNKIPARMPLPYYKGADVTSNTCCMKVDISTITKKS